MSIYATIWSLRFPRYGDDYVGCEWIEVTAQGVPAHIGTPTPGFGYEDGDPYAEFLPPPVEVTADGDSEFMRAAVTLYGANVHGSLRSLGRPMGVFSSFCLTDGSSTVGSNEQRSPATT